MDARDNDRLKESEKEPCFHCKKHKTFESYDGCLGTLDGVANACCGHGREKGAYVQFFDGVTISGDDAKAIQEILKRNRSDKPEMEKLQFMAGSVKWILEDINER